MNLKYFWENRKTHDIRFLETQVPMRKKNNGLFMKI